MPAVTYPHTFHDNVLETASGVQVDDNFNAVKTAVEACLGLLTPANMRVAFGKGNTGTFVGGSLGTNVHSAYEASIPHGLGAVPQYATVIGGTIAIQEGAGAYPVVFAVASVDATSIVYKATALGVTNNATTFYWLAIG